MRACMADQLPRAIRSYNGRVMRTEDWDGAVARGRVMLMLVAIGLSRPETRSGHPT